jgi:hypothetical protein
MIKLVNFSKELYDKEKRLADSIMTDKNKKVGEIINKLTEDHIVYKKTSIISDETEEVLDEESGDTKMCMTIGLI